MHLFYVSVQPLELGQAKFDTKNTIYRVKYAPINVVLPIDIASKLNVRQLWFLSELQNGSRIKASAIEVQWSVNLSTAKRDIKPLMELQLVKYAGSRKTGHYAICS